MRSARELPAVQPVYGSPEWELDRRNYIGASDVPAIMGASPYASGYDIWLQKKHGIAPTPNEAMRMGHLLEPVVAQLYQERFTEVKLETRGTMPHPKYPWLRATLDRMVIGAHGIYPLEIKSTSAYLGDKWGDEYTDLIPDHVLIQLQVQLMVTGLPVGHAAVLIGGNEFRAPFIVERDAELQEMILHDCEVFRALYLLGDEEPKDEGPNREDNLKRKYKTHTDVRLRADADTEEWLAELSAAKRDREAAEERESAAKTALMSAIGGNYGVDGVNGKAIWYHTNGRASYDFKGLCAQLNVPPDVQQQFTKRGADFRTFRFAAPKAG